MHARSLDCHSQIAQAKDTEWVGTVLAFLKTLINARSAKDRELVEKALNNHDILGHGRENFFTDLLRDLKTSAGQMDQGRFSLIFRPFRSLTITADLTVPNHPLFAVSIAPVEPRTNDDGDGCYLDIIVTNRIDFVRNLASMSSLGTDTHLDPAHIS